MTRRTLPQRRNRMWLRDPEEGGGGGNSLPTGFSLGTGGDGGEDNGGDGGGDGGQQQQEQQQTAEQFTPITSQEDLDRILTRKVRQVERRYKDFDAIQAKAQQYDALAAASQTDQERAVAEAEAAAEQRVMAKAVPRVVRSEFKAQAKEVGLSREQLDVLLEDLDLTRYATDEGEPDEDKIARKVKAIAPSRQQDPPPDFGQGRRGGNGKTKDMNAVIREAAGRG